MKRKSCQVLAQTWLAAASLIVGCSTASVPPVADQLILYSIDGRERFPPGHPPKTISDESFHSYPVVGKINILDAADRHVIMAAFYKSIDEGEADGKGPAGCFWPRHGIRTVTGGKTVDYVICFECLNVHIHSDNESTYKLVSATARDLLNSYLTEAGISLVPDQTAP